MTVSGAILIAAWVVFFTYWWWTSRSAASAETIRQSGGNVGWLVANGVLFAILARWGYHLRAGESILRPAGTAMAVGGAALAAWARHTLGRNWSKDVAIVARQQIISTGAYRYLRHPIYTGFLLMALGTALFVETIGVFLLVSLLAAFLVVKGRQEETLLASAYPREYPEYRRRTAALVPFVY
jgi:protein-S-isoprenylcysteine O-methyltransferase